MLSPWVFLNYILPSQLAGPPLASPAEGGNREDCKLSDESYHPHKGNTERDFME